jgi:branched-subunit amino acid aminotransferase/4-amino-4-deoxychorismate lyase
VKRIAVVDGARVFGDRASISPFARGLWFGEGVFETTRTYGASIFALTEHLERLLRSAASIGLTLPCTLETLADEARLAREAFGDGDAIVRILLTAGDESHTTRIVMAEALEVPSAEQYERGFSVITRNRPSPTFSGAKTSSYLPSLLARRGARASGADELVFIHDGRVREGATSNVLAVIRGTLVTPKLDDDVLAGITRAHVLAIARRLDIAIEERDLDAGELRSADEAMLTSTLRGIAPVTRIDGDAIADGAPGPVTRRLRAAFRTETDGRGLHLG